MKNKILKPHVKGIIESNDFAKGFSLLETHAINQEREGLFGIVKQNGLDRYLISPKILLGSETEVNSVEGIKYSRDVLGERWKNKSSHNLVNCKAFQEACLEKDIPFEIPIKYVSKNHNWNMALKDSNYEFFDNFNPYLIIHNHPNEKVIPSISDLKTGFSRSNLAKEKFYSIITSKGVNEKFPFLITSSYGLLDKKKIEKIEFNYQKLYENIDNRITFLNASSNKRMLMVLFGEFQKQEILEGFDWDYFIYDSKKRKILEVN